MVTVWWSAVGLIHYSFLNPNETIISEKYTQQINEMHWKLQRLQLALVNRMGPILLYNTLLYVTQPVLQKLNKLGYEILPLPPSSPDFSPTDLSHLTTPSSSISTNFLQAKCCHNQKEAENAFQELVKSQSKDFYATGIHKFIFLLAKMCWL